MNAIIDGQFFAAGDPLPFTNAADVPESLRPFIATGDEAPFAPGERNVYDMPPPLRRQARRLETIAQERDAAEAVADAPLREDLQAALEAAHERGVGVTKAQMAFNQDVADAAHAAAHAAAPRQLYVRRGGEMGHVERCRLKPGEHVCTHAGRRIRSRRRRR